MTFKKVHKTIKAELKDGVAVFTIDNPPVNQMSPQLSNDFHEAINEGFSNEEVKAIVLTGTGKNFVAGADITQLQAMKERDKIFQRAFSEAHFLSSIEIGPKPVIAAINGNCLGGGLELAMVCHYRIAVKGAKLGQPEVQIGVIPGAGGTQRLPRLIGLPDALEMITTGQPIKAEEGLKKGLIDEVVEEDKLFVTSLKAAHRFLLGELNRNTRMTRYRNDRLPNPEEKRALLEMAKKTLAFKAKGYIAPFKAIDAIENGLSSDIEADIEREITLFTDCATSDVAKNLIGIFLNTRAAGRLPRIRGIEPQKIKTVAMLGGGTMGSGITNLLLSNGFNAILWDINDEAIQKGVVAIRKTYDYPIKKGKMTQEQLDRMLKERLITTTSLEDLGRVDLIIEAVLEEMKIKQGIWKQLEGICRQEVIFGTNTSALPITEMATVLKDPSRMIGLHFFNPAERMQLLEIICGKKTSDKTISTSVAFARIIKKVPIVVNDGPGFYVSRQLTALIAGFIPLISNGVDPLIIEEALVDFGMPMGPATLSDLTGIDVNFHVEETFQDRLGERYKIYPLTKLVHQTGCYGRKTGAGWFDYRGEKPVPNPKVFEVVDGYLKENEISARTMSKQEVVDLMLSLAINEAAYIIQEGICDRPQDMDLAMIYGTGFPTYRGGILRYADKWGLQNVYQKLLELEKQYGIRFRPANLIKEMAETGKSFYQD